jgi:hypothetical protein
MTDIIANHAAKAEKLGWRVYLLTRAASWPVNGGLGMRRQ